MRTPILILLFVAIFFSKANLSAQGLVAVQNYSADFKTEQPLTFSLSSQGGYDALSYRVNSPFAENIESAFVQGGFGVAYTDMDQTTPWTFSLDTSVIHYVDGVPRFDDTFYNARASVNFEHRFSERLRISNNFFLTYGVEPNNAFGVSTALWNGQFLYGYNNFNVSYAWTPRFSTTTSYTIDGIAYEDEIIATPEDRYTHLFAQQFSYAISKRTSIVAEYRYRMMIFDQAVGKDINSHFALVGVDHAWSERMSGSARAGAEFYSSDRSDEVGPYAETALNYSVDRQTMVRWFAALGFNGAELAAFSSRYGLNTGIQINHNITKRFSVNSGASYSYSQFDSGGAGDVTEHSALLSAGLGYQLFENLNLNASYSYSFLDSSDALREFDRHRVSLGATASF
jgi:hypothetical protein